MANAVLQEKKLWGEFVLVPLQVSADGLQEMVVGLRPLHNFAGTIVSMPHKSTIVPLLDEVSPEVRLVGAANVIRREPDGRLVGAVFDGEGFVAGLQSARYEVRNKRGFLVGAGGAASAVAFALAKHDCASLTTVNRIREQAVTLAARVHDTWPQVSVHAETRVEYAFDIAINATSLGMKSEDDLPMRLEVIERSALIAECVIAPEMTRLLEIAKSKGRALHTGVPMLAEQMNLLLQFMSAGDKGAAL
jgi:shikimate dehydrogenase